MIETFIVLLFIILTSIAGYLLRSLSFSGAIAALITGIMVFAGFGVKGLLVLGVFFSTSSLWSKFRAFQKKSIEEKLAKGGTRDWRQVAANGGAAALFSLVHLFDHSSIWLIAFSICIASANSDTWASEIGTLSKNKPLYIRSFKRVERGTSGAISLLGSLAAMAGSITIALVSLWFFQLHIIYFMIIFLFGFLGNVIDTLFGAFYQQVYVCLNCRLETEKRYHCHQPTKRIKGFALVDNDMVNFLSGFFAAVLAIGVVALIK